MALRSSFSLLKWPAVLVSLVGLLAAAYKVNELTRPQAITETKTIESHAGIIKLGKELADSHQLRDEPARAIDWYPRITVYGRVVPNPQATLELRSPFAGTLRADSDKWLTPGQRVRAGQVLGHVEIRAGPQERLDIRVKLAEARAKEKGATDVLKIRQEQLDRLLKQPGVESLVRHDLDNARVLVAEAQTQLATAKAAVTLWQNALDVLDKH